MSAPGAGSRPADQHLRAVRGEGPAAPPAGSGPCALSCPPAPGAPRRDAASAGHRAQLAPVLSAQLSISFPFRPPFPPGPLRRCGLASKASSRRRRRPPESPTVRLAPQAPRSECLCTRVTRSFRGTLRGKYSLTDPESPRPGFREVLTGKPPCGLEPFC